MILEIELCKAVIAMEQHSNHASQWNFELEAGVCARLPTRDSRAWQQ